MTKEDSKLLRGIEFEKNISLPKRLPLPISYKDYNPGAIKPTINFFEYKTLIGMR